MIKTAKPENIPSSQNADTERHPTILVVDDDEAVRNLFHLRLSGTYDVVHTGDPEQAVGIALERKPDAILLDLMMPGLSGFELCQWLHSLSYTSRIPIFVVTGEAGSKYREHCASLGARGYFQKPIDFALLKATIATELQGQQPERRKHKRVQMRISLKLRGIDANGNQFEQLTTTENVSARGFLAACRAALLIGVVIEVFAITGGLERFAGRAQAVRKDASGMPWQRYGFELLETTAEWLLQD